MSHYAENVMALSPYKSPQSPLNRSRSSSCSSPIRNSIVFQEIYSLGANTLFRSYSCDQVFDRDANGQTFQTTQIKISSYISPEKKYTVKKMITTPLDEIHNSPKELQSNISEKAPEEKKEGVENTSMKPSSVRKRFTGKMFSLLPILGACLVYFYASYWECTLVWDLNKTANELKENVFGQSEALARINSVLKMCNSSNDLFTVVFTGGVGVGKTYASSIISHNFPWSSNKLITYSELFDVDTKKLLNSDLSTCGCNLIVIDDLSVKITSEALNLIMLLNDKRQSNEKVLIILIFQVHTETERNSIIEDFKNSHVNFYHVPFKSLGQESVEKCFYAEIQRHGVVISNEEFDKLVKEKMKHIDIVKGLTGCKGVAEEVSSYYKKN